MLLPPEHEPPATHPDARVWRLRLALVGLLFALLFVVSVPPVWSAAVGAVGAIAVVLYRTRRYYLTPTRLLILKRFVFLALLALLAVGGWEYYPSVGTSIPDISGARSAQIAGVTTTDRDTLDSLAVVLAKSQPTQFHKCGACGELVVRRSFGRTVHLDYLPGHDVRWYEVIYRGNCYRVPRAEFLAVMRRMGAEVPLNCP